MSKLRVCVLISTLIFTGTRAVAADRPCLQQRYVVRLSTLAVCLCLTTRDQEDNDPPAAEFVVETIKNVSSRPLELRLYKNVHRQIDILIIHGRREVSKLLRVPLTDGPDEGFYDLDYRIMQAGESLTLTYKISDFMTEPPIEGASYFTRLGYGFVYRFLDEPRDQAYALRREEEIASGVKSQEVWFEDVRLK